MAGATHHFACHLEWTGAAKGPVRDYEGYSRDYRVEIEGKPAIAGSAAAAFRGDPALHNPEDLLVAALSACHFLTYAAMCARAGLELRGYSDDATGEMAWDPERKVMAFRDVLLRPRARMAPGTDTAAALALHDKAHHGCFIANSVSFPVRNQPIVEIDGA